nr:hypothetical protein [Allomuricauda sp.]
MGEFLKEALESFTAEKEAWDKAEDLGYEKGILLERQGSKRLELSVK